MRVKVARVSQAVQVVFFIENSSHEAFEMEETPNFDVLTCSQGSDLGQEQLKEIEQKAQAKSTKKGTSFAPLLRLGANDATRARNKQYALQKSSYCPILVQQSNGKW